MRNDARKKEPRMYVRELLKALQISDPDMEVMIVSATTRKVKPIRAVDIGVVTDGYAPQPNKNDLEAPNRHLKIMLFV